MWWSQIGDAMIQLRSRGCQTHLACFIKPVSHASSLRRRYGISSSPCSRGLPQQPATHKSSTRWMQELTSTIVVENNERNLLTYWACSLRLTTWKKLLARPSPIWTNVWKQCGRQPAEIVLASSTMLWVAPYMWAVPTPDPTFMEQTFKQTWSRQWDLAGY